ncbi:MAG: DNA mismatch repair protein MutS [Candidatus Eiseniibacteriota bacterium]|nr:MAG: DNA mismatch repair protein MutS [Candidatus Eisenbacteria bacterium]
MKKQTPMMRQYSKIKQKHRDSILLFRMGDFYEMFYEDAVTASRVLGIALTSRDKDGEGRIPLAGIPWHSAERYISRLIRSGHSVAVCEQTEDSARAKRLVSREVVEVITPGTVMSHSLLAEGENNYVVAVADGNTCGFALADVSTGEFVAAELTREEVLEEVARLSPSEILLSQDSGVAEDVTERSGAVPGFRITRTEGWRFSMHSALSELLSHFGVASLECFGFEREDAGVSAAGALLGYLKELKGTGLRQIFKLARYRHHEFLFMDDTTIRNLELVRSIRTGTEEGSLLEQLRRTETPMGARFLRANLLRPLTGPESVHTRQEAVGELVENVVRREKLAEALHGLGDVERLVSRIVNRKGGPREIVSLGACLGRLPAIRAVLAEAKSSLLMDLAERIGDTHELASLVERALVEDAPVLPRNPGFIRTGFCQELDEVRGRSAEAKQWIKSLQDRERKRTQIPSLKLGFNKVFGYYIEVTKPNLSRAPEDYVRKQTLVNAERFITAELKEKESTVLGAEEREMEIELRLLEELQQAVSDVSSVLLEAAATTAEADFILSLARVGVERRYVRPKVGGDSRILLSDSRHPVVEAMLEEEEFVPNDVEMDCERAQILIVTGPNMAGKSTFTRQVALAVIMAQMGGYVAASSAEIGVVDRVFCRLGASDDIARGRSTFLAEMSETASILNNCTPRSLVVMDEIGRGTSTFDGMSIAWAVLEYLHELGPRTLFATHYHELTVLASKMDRVKNLNVLVKEWGEKIVFVRKVVEGASDRSYGIQVARLAGLPELVVERAKEVLDSLENDRVSAAPRAKATTPHRQLDLFAESARRLIAELAALDTERLTPIEALRELDGLRRKYAGVPGARPETSDSGEEE